MSTTPILKPLAGERVLELSPEDAAAAAATWLRRPNLFPGRALSAPTLEARNRWQAGRIALRGQAYTAGVVQGFELDYRTRAVEGGQRPEVVLQIAAGRGLAASGEDVVAVRSLAADFWSLPVVAPPAVFEGGGFGGGSLQPRQIGPALGALLAEFPSALPRAGVLVLQPATSERADIDPNDPCDRCACDEGDVGYEDWRYADAARLLWYAWPEDWQPLPAGAQARNRIAQAIFDAERGLPPGELLPWEAFGVPIALIGVNAAYEPQFVDRSAVVRQGGRPRYSRLQLGEGGGLDSNVRLPALWQAQIEQLAEQVASLGEIPPAQLAQAFDRLPPCGVLPRSVVDLQNLRSEFFPEAFDLDAVPIPLEQLDLAIREAAPMAPFDLARSERLRLLVPVSQASWEPRLLMSETLDPEFTATLERFLLDRARALAARQSLRLKGFVLTRAIRGRAPPVPAIADDPQALEPEALEPWGPPPGAGGHRSALRSGLHEHGFTGATAGLAPQAGDRLYTWVYLDPDHPPRTLMIEWRSGEAIRRAYWGENLIERGTDGRNTRLRIGDLPEAGRWLRLEVPAAALDLEDRTIEGIGFVLYDGRAAYGTTGIGDESGGGDGFGGSLPAGARVTGDEVFDFISTHELLGPLEPHYGVVPVPEAAAKMPEGASETLRQLQQDGALAVLSEAEVGQLQSLGVEGFIAYLKARADRADDLVDYGFVKVQTDIYRVRQLVLDATDATRLAVSPALAGIAKAETAVASKEQISKYIAGLRQTQQTANTANTANMANPADRAMMMAAPPPPPQFETMSYVAPATLETRAAPTGKTLDPALRYDYATATGIEPIKAKPAYTRDDITDARPIVGKAEIRTLSIVDRLQQPKAQEARDYSTSTRHEAVLALLRLADELMAADGDVVPGLFEDVDVWGLAGDFGESPENSTPPRRSLTQFIDRESRASLLNALLTPPVRLQFDEATHFSDSADLADRTIALLRQVEGRIKLYRNAIAACQAALSTLSSELSALGLRERQWAEVLAEARHDVAVTRALIDEEQRRLDGINARRAAVLEHELRFVAYLRPRSAGRLSPAATRTLDPGLLPAPVPECLGTHEELPDELRDMLAVVREAPAAWFGQGRAFVAQLDRSDSLLRLVQTAKLRAPLVQQRPALASLSSATALSASIAKVQLAQQQSVSLARTSLLQLSPASLARLSWQNLQAEVVTRVSLGDLIDGERGLVARRAASFFDTLSRICGCLHAGFSSVPASIRLDWVETLSQFDSAPKLRNLASLSRFAEIDYAERRRLQALVDWLFDQIEPNQAKAVGLLNDLVRLCLLLASHAPVGRIIAGRVPRPLRARPGLRIPLLALDPGRLSIGMEALVYRGDSIVARAVVEDLAQAEASARVTYTAQAELALDETMRVQFGPATSLSLSAAALPKALA